MSASLDQLYFDWLKRQVGLVESRNRILSYDELLHILYTKEFIWLVPNDDNRVEDGKDLRDEFLDDAGIRLTDNDLYWMNLGCSMLEMLIALSRRLEFETTDPANQWFWILLDNLELSHHSDHEYILKDEIEEVLDRVIWRQYNYNGGGGLFPLVYPEQDQRKVEIWSQLNSYIIEND